MTTLDKIKAEIQKVLDKERDFTSENAKAQALALLWVLELFDKYASEECDNDCEHCTWIECPKEPSEDMTREEAIRIIDRMEDALDYAEIADDNGNVTLLKFYKNKYSDDFKLDSYDGENQKTLAAGGLRYVVDRYGELLDMDPAAAIIEIAKE